MQSVHSNASSGIHRLKGEDQQEVNNCQEDSGK